MDLLFNTKDEKSTEISDILGFIDADITIKELHPYITRFSREVKKWIGGYNYAICLGKYTADNLDDFTKSTRYTIALGAFREFAMLSDVSYTTQGRSFRSDDHMKAAYEWQIEKSNEALERSFYSSLNELIHLSINASDYEQCPGLSLTKGMYVNSIDVFQEFVHIDNSYLLFLKLIPSLKLAEHQLILSRCSSNFEEFKNEGHQEIKSLIQNICVYFAMIDGLKKNSVQLFPHGVVQVVSSSKKNKTAKRLDVEATVLYYKNEISILLQQLESKIAKTKKVISYKRNINFEDNDGFVTM